MSVSKTSIFVSPRRESYEETYDRYYTPKWATRALFKYAMPPQFFNPASVVLEPAAGRGHIVDVLKEQGCNNIIDRDIDTGTDFLDEDENPKCDWIITNPPYKLSLPFALKSIHLSRQGKKAKKGGVAFFVRYTFLETKSRYAELFSQYKPSIIAQFTERVGLQYGKTTKKAGSAVAYCWVIWIHPNPGYLLDQTRFVFIPPCKTELEKDEDYDDA